MRFRYADIERLVIQLVASIVYGAFVFSFVSAWSFDYEAVVDTIKYFQSNTLTYIELLAFNSFSTYGLSKILVDKDAEFVASLFYAICAALRFFIYGRLLRLMWFLPIFFSMAVMLDFNMSRYSLSITIFIFIFGVWARNNFQNMGLTKFVLIAPAFFHLHHFSIAFIGLLSKISLRFRIMMILMIPASVLSLNSIFSRFLSTNVDPFPRISLIYLVLSLLLILSIKISKKEIEPFATVIILLMVFHLTDIKFNSAYYTRFSFLIFDVTLLIIALRKNAFVRTNHNLKFNVNYLKVTAVCSLSATYQVILINGNIWRFFL